MELTDLLNKLDKIAFTQAKTDKLSSKKWSVSLSYKMQMGAPFDKDYPVQIVLNVRYKNGHVQTWGCTNNADNVLVVDWWKKRINQVHELKYDEQRKNEKTGEYLFKNL